MTIKKQTRCGGHAALLARQALQTAHQHIDMTLITKPNAPIFNLVVGFNEKDQLQLTNKEDKNTEDEKLKDKSRIETIRIDDITNCVNVETYPHCTNTLVFYISKNLLAHEAIAIKFETEQDFRRIYFTYKYFKMRNRLTKNSSTFSSSENLFSKKKLFSDTLKTKKSSIDNSYVLGDNKYYKNEFNLMHTTDNDGVQHLSVYHKNGKYDQPMSLIGIRSNIDLGEIDSIINTDADVSLKPDRKRLFHRKPKAPTPPTNKDQKVLKGEFVRVNVDRVPDLIPKDLKVSKIPDVLPARDVKAKFRNSPSSSNLWSSSNNNKVSTLVAGYESDREDWRSVRSQFSTSAYDSLSRPTKAAMALSLRKPFRSELHPQYFLQKPKIQPQIPFTRPNNYLPRPPRLPRPPEIMRNQLNLDHRKYSSLQNLDLLKKTNEKKVEKEPKKNNTLSTRISGLTNKLRDLGTGGGTLGRMKSQSQEIILKPVIKKQEFDGSKRPVVRTCSAEPPKKVTFSAFATVQVL